MKPMDWVAGDVHHVDILIKREDGSLCTPKAVAWLELATNRAYMSLFLMPKDQMIRREHVIESFVDMCTDRNWGVPTKLYLDRSGEYNWSEFTNDLFKLKHAIDVQDWIKADDDMAGVQRSKAYNPQSKIIESTFGQLEHSVFSQIPGYIGGDRMKKKTQNQGKDPVPYPGDFDALKISIQNALAYHHKKDQQGHLDGRTPDQAFQQFIDEGWKSILLDSYELGVAFSEKETRRVKAGGTFSWKGEDYRHDNLMHLAAMTSIIVRQPLFGDRTQLYVFSEEDESICIAEPVPVYRFGDPAGAGQQQRQAKLLNQQIRSMEAETDKLDMEQSMRDVVAFHGQAPQAESRGVASISPEHRAMSEMKQAAPEQESCDAIQRKQDEELELLERYDACLGNA